jgi:hypothetical protein
MRKRIARTFSLIALSRKAAQLDVVKTKGV